jgi:hypothetical protein
MQFQMAHDANRRITLPFYLTKKETLDARCAAQLAGVPLEGIRSHQQNKNEREEFEKELNKRLIKFCRDMPEERLRSIFKIVDEGSSFQVDCKSGVTIKSDSEGNAFIKYSGQAALPKLAKVGHQLQERHGITLGPGDEVNITLKIGGQPRPTQYKGKSAVR